MFGPDKKNGFGPFSYKFFVPIRVGLKMKIEKPKTEKISGIQVQGFNGVPFSYRNRTPHLYDFFLLRFIKCLLRAYKYR